MNKNVKKGVAAAVVLMFLSNVLSRVIGFVRTQIQAGFIGTDHIADAYALSFLLPDTLNYILAGGCLTVTFIPLYQSLEKRSPREAHEFVSNLLNVGTVIFLFSIVLGYLITPAFIAFVGGQELHGESQDLAVSLTRLVLPAQLFFFWGAVIKGIQFSRQSFLYPALTPLIYNVGIIICGVALFESHGVAGFSVGVLVGAFLGNVVFQLPGMQCCAVQWYPRFSFRDPHLRHWGLKTLPLIIGVGFTYSNMVLIRFFGARSSDGIGSVSALDYSYRLFMVLVALLGQSIASGMYPFITEMAMENRRKDIEETLFPLIVQIGVILWSITWILPFVSYDLIALLFERRAFTAHSTLITSRALTAYAPGLFFFTAVFLFNRLYYAFEKTLTPTIITTISLVLVLPLFFILSQTWGVVGVAFPSALFSALIFILLSGYWKKLFPDSKVHFLWLRLVGVIALSSPGALMALGISRFPIVDQAPPAVRIFVVGGMPFFLLLSLFNYLGFISARDLLNKIRRRK